MLLNIKCSAVTSVAVHLEFDNNSSKDIVLSKGDLIDVEYNRNGLRKRIQGKVISINAVGTDPKGWTIIVDGSDDFSSEQVRFSPMNILDIELIRKANEIKFIETPNDASGIMGLRIVKGRLQYTSDGFNWDFVKTDKKFIIKDEEGTIRGEEDEFFGDEDIIKDEVNY